jgi:bile acid-coenzyme A ligase
MPDQDPLAVNPVSIAHRVTELAREVPDEPVLWCIAPDGSEVAYTWSDIHRRSSQLAVSLRSRGLAQGDRMSLGLRNSFQFVIGAFAAWKLGATPVPMRFDLPDWELGRLRDVIAGTVHLGDQDVSWIDGTAANTIEELPDVVAPSVQGICSSGSTGLPKVIMAKRPGIFDPSLNSPLLEYWREVPRPQTVLVLGPMYHVNGFAGLGSMLARDDLVVMEKFDAANVVDVIERHRVTTFNCTPTMLKRIADLPDIAKRDLSSIEWLSQGAAPMPPYLVRRWIELIGAEHVVMAYGMSEGLGITAIKGDEWLEREGSVGRPMRDTEVRILDPTGSQMAPHATGEIYLRSLSAGGAKYLGEVPQLRMTEDGFGTVGDVGYVDEDGFLYLIDRRTDLIISGGANIYPAEVEIALMDHPKIADVVVIGLQDPEWGRRVHAIIEAADAAEPPSLEEIRGFVKERLAPYKVPKSIEVVDVIPRSEATKVNRGALVEARGG